MMGYVPDPHKLWAGTSDDQLIALSNERLYFVVETKGSLFLALGCLTVSGILAENTLLKARSKLLIPRHRPLAPSFVLVGRRPIVSP